MSVGNLKTSGQKGTNWTWQYRVLLGLDKIAANVATNGKEYEAELVSITCAGPTPPAGTVIRLEVRVWDAVTGAFTSISYYEPGSTTPDPANYSGCTKTYLESGDATETTLQAILTKNTAIEVDTTAISSNTGDIATNTANNKTNTDTLRVATNTGVMTRGTGSVTVTELVKSISVYNAHASATGTINIGGAGAVNLLAGETVNFDAGGNGNKFPASHFVIDGGGSADMLIIYVY